MVVARAVPVRVVVGHKNGGMINMNCNKCGEYIYPESKSPELPGLCITCVIKQLTKN